MSAGRPASVEYSECELTPCPSFSVAVRPGSPTPWTLQFTVSSGQFKVPDVPLDFMSPTNAGDTEDAAAPDQAAMDRILRRSRNRLEVPFRTYVREMHRANYQMRTREFLNYMRQYGKHRASLRHDIEDVFAASLAGSPQSEPGYEEGALSTETGMGTGTGSTSTEVATMIPSTGTEKEVPLSERGAKPFASQAETEGPLAETAPTGTATEITVNLTEMGVSPTVSPVIPEGTQEPVTADETVSSTDTRGVPFSSAKY